MELKGVEASVRGFSVRIDELDGTIRATFSGELTIDAEESLTAAVRLLDLARRPQIVVDFAAVPYVNSAGIAALLAVLMMLRDRTCGIRFTGMNRHLEKIFRMTGFPSLVTMG